MFSHKDTTGKNIQDIRLVKNQAEGEEDIKEN